MVQRSEHVRRVLDLAWEEAALLGHCYLGPEHVVLGVLRDGGSGAAEVLRARGVDLQAARAALRRLAACGVVPGPRPSDAELLGTLGIDLDAIRRGTERTFGLEALGWATREATRARRGGVARVPRTPLREPPVLAARALQLAHEQATALGMVGSARSCCCWGWSRTSTRAGPDACPTGGPGSCTPRSACRAATGARPARCWRRSGSTSTSCATPCRPSC